MTAPIAELLEKAKSGEADAFARLVDFLRTAADADGKVLLDSLHSPDGILRRAAARVAPARPEPGVVQALAALVHDPELAVRRALAEALIATPPGPLDEIVGRLLDDDEDEVRYLAVQAARSRPLLEATLAGRMLRETDDLVRLTIARALSTSVNPVALHTLVTAIGQEDNRAVADACAQSLEKQLENLGGYPENAARPRLPVLENALQRIASLGLERFMRLGAWLTHRVAHDSDPEKLRTFGTLLTEEAEAGRLPRAHGVASTCNVVRQALAGAPPRAVVLLGEPGSGKTAIVNELVHLLRHDYPEPWQVLRVSPADLLAGTQYLGEWQTKLRNLVQAVRFPRRVVLYIPNLEELSEAGRSAHNDTSIATALAPHIERGEVVILGETTPEAFRTGLGAVGSLRRLFHVVEVREASIQQTKTVLQAVRDEAKAHIPDSVLDRLIELADFYLPGIAQPGRSVGLLRRLVHGESDSGDDAGEDGSRRLSVRLEVSLDPSNPAILSPTLTAAQQPVPTVTERDILRTLSTSTGIPIDFLDDSVAMDWAHVRNFFETRVIGQPEAAEAVVDLVALIKSGLTDPGKPFGVLLFVGPTGVGKTEMARTLAELLFGDPGRLLRLDMSEFATYESHERLLGFATTPGLLTAPVRERPFSVVLLDEIEKAHPTVFDLCLAIFDAGRLTDRQGRTADFRRTIIILTSNIGSTTPDEGPFGFKEPDKPASNQGDLRELGRVFRPEFLNRLDRIVTFRPLEAETAEKIARREVARVLERSGIARRRLTVDVDPAVIAHLLREGYSQMFGARPLKRTVERLLLQPMAWAIAGGSVAPGSVLRLVVRAGRVDVEIVPPDAEIDGETRGHGDTGIDGPGALSQRLPVASSPMAEKILRLAEQVARLREQSQRLAARKSELLTRTTGATFRDDPVAASVVHDEIFRLDSVLASLGTLERAAAEQREFASQRRLTDRDIGQIRRRLDSLESQAKHLAFLVGHDDPRDLADAYLCLTRITPEGPGLDAVMKLGMMYRGLAERRGLELTILNDRAGGNPSEDSITLQLTGAGAFALLRGEAGLHQFSNKRVDRAGRRAVERDVVRVEVLRVPPEEVVFPPSELRIETQTLTGVPGRMLVRPKQEIQLLHVPSMISVRAWTDCTRTQAVERLTPLLWARVEAGRATLVDTPAMPAVIRRYILGPSPAVKDLRAGKTTGRLDLVLKGNLEPFFQG